MASVRTIIITFIRAHAYLLLLLGVLFLSLAFRLALTPIVFHDDILWQAGWGWWIKNEGINNFYENDQWIYGWPNHPPLISILYGFSFKLHAMINTVLVGIGHFIAIHRLAPTMFLWLFSFNVWFNSEKYKVTPFLWGELISLKITPIVADLVIAIIVYVIAQKIRTKRFALLLSGLYLISPFSWYLSGIWGQTDQLGFIFLFLSFFLLLWRYPVIAPIVFAIRVGLKPTSLIFTPLFLWIALKNKKTIISTIIGGIISVILYYFLVQYMSDTPFIAFNQMLQKKMFVRGEIWTYVNTFNFWGLLTHDNTPYAIKVLFIPLKVWGYVILAVFYAIAIAISRKRDLISMYIAMFIVGFAGWLFMVTMHERYLFPALGMGIILVIYYPKLLKYWIILSLIFLINLYHGWYYPASLNWFRAIIDWNGIVVRILAVINIALFVKMVLIMRPFAEIKK